MSDDWAANWRSVNCFSGYHPQCRSERCTCACHERKPETKR